MTMTLESSHLLRTSFARVEAQGHVAALVFYRRLFELAPHLRPMFRTEIEVQSRKLIDMLATLLALLERPAELEATLRRLGASHRGYGVRAEHYRPVGQALLDMLAATLGPDFTPEVRDAWATLYGQISAAMQSAGAA